MASMIVSRNLNNYRETCC